MRTSTKLSPSHLVAGFLSLLAVYVFLFGSTLLAAGESSVQSADEVALRTLAEKYFAAYQSRDLDVLMSLWSDKSPDLATSRQGFQQTFASNNLEVKSLTIHGFATENGKAMVRVLVDVSALDLKTGKPATGFGKLNRTFHCVKDGEVWKVWQYVASEQELATGLASARTDEERKALLASEKELVTVELVQALLAESRRAHNQGSLSVVIDIANLARDTANELDYKKGVSDALRILGIAHRAQGSYAKALEHQESSLKLAEEIDDKAAIGAALLQIGHLSRDQGNFTKAEECYESARKLSEELADKAATVRALGSIGTIHDYRGNYTQGLEYLHASLKLAEEIGDKDQIAQQLHNIAVNHRLQGDSMQVFSVFSKKFEHLRRTWQCRAGCSGVMQHL